MHFDQCAVINMAVRYRVIAFKRRNKAGCQSHRVFYGRKMTVRVVELPRVTLRNVRSLPSSGASNASTWGRTIAMLMLLIIGNMQVRSWGLAFILGFILMQGSFL